jgi:hypothetical protein
MHRLPVHEVVSLTVPTGALNKSDLLRYSDWNENRCLLSSIYQGSVFRISGSLQLVKPFGDLRFIVTDLGVAAEPSTRVVIPLRVTIERIEREEPAEQIEGLTVSIAADGLLIDCNAELPAGERLGITISIPHHTEGNRRTSERRHGGRRT